MKLQKDDIVLVSCRTGSKNRCIMQCASKTGEGDFRLTVLSTVRSNCTVGIGCGFTRTSRDIKLLWRGPPIKAMLKGGRDVWNYK